MELLRNPETGCFLPTGSTADVERALQRFREKCQFEPETGCVVWIGGQTMGRGKHIPYGSFWFDRRRWFAHRWAALHIHGLDIEGLYVDHCCPNIPIPNTLCVEHLQAVTLERNSELMHERRKRFIHLEVGLLRYEDVYGPPAEHEEEIPFYEPPKWFKPKERHDDRSADCPF